MIWYTVGIPFIAICSFLLWRHLPVGKLYGRVIRLHEWPRWRMNLRHERILKQLKAADALDGEARLRALRKLLLKHGDAPLGLGDRILESAVAAGAEPGADSFLNMLREVPELTARPILRGLTAAALSSGFSHETRRRYFDELARHSHSKEPHWSHLKETLLRLDQDRAVLLLTTGSDYTAGSSVLAERLHALRIAGAAVPRERLEPLVAALPRIEAGNCHALAALLVLWAAHEPDDARRELRRLTDEGGKAALDTAEALLELESIPHPVFGVSDWIDVYGEENAPREARNVWLVAHHFRYPLSIGGFEEFFRGESGRRFHDVLQALGETGARMEADRLREAGALFGPAGPPRQDDLRSEMMDEDFSERLHALRESWNEAADPDLLLTLIRYQLRFGDVFRSLKATP